MANLSKFLDTMPGPTLQQSQNKDQEALNLYQAAQQAPAVSGGITPTPTTTQVGEVGAKLQDQAAQARLQEQQNEGQKQLQEQQVQIQEQGMDRQKRLAQMQSDLDKEQDNLTQQAFNLTQAKGQEIFSQTMSFKRDQLQQTAWNTRQLADWAALKAQSDEQLRDYEQSMSQAFTRKTQILQTAHAQVMQAMEQNMQKAEQEKDHALQEKLVKAKNDLEMKIRKAQADADNNASIFSALGSVVGGIAGAVLTGGTPIGAMVGASIGGGLTSTANAIISGTSKVTR